MTVCESAGLPASLAWARTFLPDYFSADPAPFHVELMGDLEDPARRLIARIAPRGHAKSTCAALAYPLWCLCEQRRRNIVIITHESSLARQFVRDIRTELEANELLLERYGDLAVDAPPAPAGRKRKRTTRGKWTEEKFTTCSGLTVQAKGSGASFRGTRVGPQRPDLIICDDIEKDEEMASADSRQKLEYWLRRVVMPALSPDGQLIVVGSLIHHDSLLARLRDRRRFPRWDYKVYRAIEARQAENGQWYRVALWPGRWPLERLEEERARIGTLAFEQEYMANPIDDSIRVFPQKWLRRYDPVELETRGDSLVTLMAADPATGAADGDFFALWIGSLDLSTGIIYTRELTIERIGIVEQVRRIESAALRWRPVKIGIETAAYQVALKDVLDDNSRRRRLYLPIVGLVTTANKVARIVGSSPFYENGTFLLPPVLDPEVEAQFLQFPKSKHDDAPDVCAMGIELARTLRGGRLEGLSRRQQKGPAQRGEW
ncbi:MAG: hypothetical protein PVJ57_13255 [Phycisphaerae bacterium]|jgi:phage terminase large subunit-like protein